MNHGTILICRAKAGAINHVEHIQAFEMEAPVVEAVKNLERVGYTVTVVPAVTAERARELLDAMEALLAVRASIPEARAILNAHAVVECARERK